MTIYSQSEELVSRCVECDLAEPESLASLGGSAPGLVDGILSTYKMEDLMVQAENKYKENTWGKPTDKQENIVAMTAEINYLKKECRGTAYEINKPKATGKKLAAKRTKEQQKTKDTKKKASDKWALEEPPPPPQ